MVGVVWEKFDRLRTVMNEKLRRRWAACEAMALGRGGISAVCEATGISRTTIQKGMREIAEAYPELAERASDQRIRRPGGGRPRLTEHDPTLQETLKKLVAPATRGDPMSPLLWTSKSTRHLAKELQRLGHQVSYRTVARMLGDIGFSLQANSRTREGKQHSDRDVLLYEAEQLLMEKGAVEKGDLIVLTIGEPIGTPGGTNTLKIVKVGEHPAPPAKD